MEIKNPELKKVVDFLEEAREKHNVAKENLEKGGQVIYANGKDSTQFDWDCNDRLCEFGYGVKDGSVWAFKLHLYKDGNAEVYCYPNGELKPVDSLKRNIMTPYEVGLLKEHMLKVADNRGMWDKTLEELGEA